MSTVHVVDYYDIPSLAVWFEEAEERWEEFDVSYDDRFNELSLAVAYFLGLK